MKAVILGGTGFIAHLSCGGWWKRVTRSPSFTGVKRAPYCRPLSSRSSVTGSSSREHGPSLSPFRP